MNLFEKIQAVSMEVMNLEKDMMVGSGNYAYKAISDTMVTLAVKKAEAKYRILSVPIKQKLVDSQVLKVVDGPKESYLYVDNIKMTIRIYDLDEPTQFVEVESYGKGIDKGDKGFGKAATFARKYALLNAYKIATGEDPDADKSISTEAANEPDAQRVTVLNRLSKDAKLSQDVCKHFGVANPDELDGKQIDKLFQAWTQKGQI
jgi:hypothetical protein